MPKYTQEYFDSIYREAFYAKEDGDISKSFELLMKGALINDPDAQNALAIAYSDGQGVEQDKNEAVRWLKKAWRIRKRSEYCSNIAIVYSELGERRQAEYWWRKAVALADGGAALSYAKFLLKVSGRPSARIINLLEIAKNSREGWQISSSAKEEAVDLLNKIQLDQSK